MSGHWAAGHGGVPPVVASFANQARTAIVRRSAKGAQSSAGEADMLISPAFAQAAAPAGGGNLFTALLPMFAIIAIFWFLLIRPQQQKAKQHRAKLDAIRRGDRILTGGGIIGTVTKVADAELTVEIADGVRVAIARATVADVLSKPEPVKREKGKGGEESETVAADKPAAGEKPASFLGGLLGGKK
jgi:preprotein translocase subunit YajC